MRIVVREKKSKFSITGLSNVMDSDPDNNGVWTDPISDNPLIDPVTLRLFNVKLGERVILVVNRETKIKFLKIGPEHLIVKRSQVLEKKFLIFCFIKHSYDFQGEFHVVGEKEFLELMGSNTLSDFIDFIEWEPCESEMELIKNYEEKQEMDKETGSQDVIPIL